MQRITDNERKELERELEKAGRDLNKLLEEIKQVKKKTGKNLLILRKRARYLCWKLADMLIMNVCFCNMCGSLTRVTFEPTPGVL